MVKSAGTRSDVVRVFVGPEGGVVAKSGLNLKSGTFIRSHKLSTATSFGVARVFVMITIMIKGLNDLVKSVA